MIKILKNSLHIPFLIACTCLLSLIACNAKQPSNDETPSQLKGNYLAYLSSLKLPEELTFCGEKVPLEIPEVRERAEREFYLNLQSPGQLILYIKRAGRFFPMFEKILKEENTPEDIKFLAVAESALFMARSPKDAIGVWQFMAPTAKSMGLQVDDYVDERRHIEKSTRAAIAYLRSGYSYSKSWSLAAAGYNMGHGSVKENMDFQKTETFYDLFLNEETSRYVLRIAVIKELMTHSEKYGLNLESHDQYQPEKTVSVKCTSGISDLTQWALQHGTTYKDVKILNPWILKRSLPAPKSGAYYVEIPSK